MLTEDKILLCYTVCCFVLMGCQCKTTETEQERVFPVEITFVDNSTCVHTHTYVGNVEESYSLQLSFPAGGKLTQLYVQKSDHVQKGKLLALVDDTQENSMLQVAQTKLHQAQDGYERAEQVYKEGGLTELKWVEVQSQLKEAQSTVVGLSKRVNDCRLYAPCNGVIGAIQASVGENIAPGQVLLTLMNISGLNVAFTVAEQDITSIRLGDTATLVVPALDNMEMRGIVAEKSLTAEPLSHTYTVKCQLFVPDSARQSILPGMIAKVRLTSQRTEGYMLPARCVLLTSDGAVVWVVQQGKAQRREVSDCMFIKESVLVRNGLNKGDSVIVAGQHKLFSGARVQINK